MGYAAAGGITMYGPLLRPRFDRKVAGVCAAFARSYGWDLTVVRLVLVLLAVFGGGGVLAYVICWVVIPEEPVALPPYPGNADGYPPPPPPNYASNYPPNTPPNTPPPTV
jgi:phage shock protein PspC (stress-responsive transcriptional regulator)